MTDKTTSYISGFWRRIVALIIDLAILGMIGFIFGFFFENTFVAMGIWARLVGFSIALLYFGLMNSKLLDGQTAGKTFLNIKVVNSKNEPISIPKSFLRYTILGTPFFLNGIHLSNESMPSYLLYLLSFIVFGGTLSIIYLYIFNKATRQSLHDLMLGTFVVNANAEKTELDGVSKKHLVVISLLFSVAIIAPILTSHFTKSEPFKELLSTQAALMQSPHATYANITVSSTHGNSGAATYINANIYLSKNTVNDSKLALEMAKIITKTFPESMRKDEIQIALIYGYDIGIWSQWFNFTHKFKPTELEQLSNMKYGPFSQ